MPSAITWPANESPMARRFNEGDGVPLLLVTSNQPSSTRRTALPEAPIKPRASEHTSSNTSSSVMIFCNSALVTLNILSLVSSNCAVCCCSRNRCLTPSAKMFAKQVKIILRRLSSRVIASNVGIGSGVSDCRTNGKMASRNNCIASRPTEMS